MNRTKSYQRRRTGIMAALAFGVILTLPGCIVMQKKFDKSVEPLPESLTLSGINDEIIIRRDFLGVPYIEAKNEDDLFFASGYVAAEDRLWQMVMMSMLMQGRLAEIAGEDTLKLDIFIRSLNAKKFVSDAMKKMDPVSLRILENYSRGVNAWLESHNNLPAEFILTDYKPEKWKPEDTLYVFGMLNMDVSGNFIEELDFLILAAKLGYEKAAWLFPVYPDENIPFEEAVKLKEVPADTIVQIKTAFMELRREMKQKLPMSVPASNNWALSGRKTASGKSIVENDTHLMLMIPNAWMLMHLKCPTYEAAGVTIPGVPFITLGYNGRVAWGATMVMADSQDLFIEKMRTEGGIVEYLSKGKWIPAVQRKETFNMQGGKPVKAVLLETNHGPLLNTGLAGVPFPPEMPVQPLPITSEYGIALSWAMEQGNRTLKAFYDIGKAGNVKEAQQAVRNVQAIYLNIVYGDRDSIAWQVTGSYPLRKKGKGILPSPGWTGEYDWTGFLAPDKRPFSMNPTEGFIATANNRTVPKNFPYQLTGSWYHPDRAERIASVLKKMDKAAMKDMLKLQGEQFSLMAEKVQRLLYSDPVNGRLKQIIKGWKNKKKKARALEALALLSPERFNAVMSANSANAAVMGAFMHCVTRGIFLDELGGEESLHWQAFLDVTMMSYSAPEDHLLYRPESPFWDNTETAKMESREDILAEALDGAILLLEDRISKNREKWQWGKIHTYYWKHEFTKQTSFFHTYLNRGPFPAGGDVHSVNVSTFTWGENFDTWNIPAMRMIVDFGLDEPMSLITVPGQSGNPSSPHYGDMIPAFLTGEGRPMPFRKENVEKQYNSVLNIKPKK